MCPFFLDHYSDPRFDVALPQTFGADLNWLPGWELRWMSFDFTGGQPVRIYHATRKADPFIRYTIFLDPDTGNWTTWEPALDSLDQQALQDMRERAARDSRFGEVILGTFEEWLEWDPSWELRWVDFTFSEGRVVEIYHVTYKFDLSIRYTIFWNPDTGNWAPWEQAQ